MRPKKPVGLWRGDGLQGIRRDLRLEPGERCEAFIALRDLLPGAMDVTGAHELEVWARTGHVLSGPIAITVDFGDESRVDELQSAGEDPPGPFRKIPDPFLPLRRWVGRHPELASAAVVSVTVAAPAAVFLAARGRRRRGRDDAP